MVDSMVVLLVVWMVDWWVGTMEEVLVLDWVEWRV